MTDKDGILECAKDYSIFQPNIDNNSLYRKEQIETLDVYLTQYQAVFVNGPKDIGKSTILSQILSKRPVNSIAVFINENNTHSLVDNDIYKDIYIQCRAFMNDYTNSDMEKDVSLTDIVKIFKVLSYYLKRNKRELLFIFDGWDLVINENNDFFNALFLTLPQLPEVKYLISSRDNEFKDRLLISNSTTYSVAILTKSEVSQIIPSASETDAEVILNSFQGIPDRIATIARLIKDGMTLNEILQNPSNESEGLYESEWDYNVKNDTQRELLGYLAYSNHSIDIKGLCTCSGLSLEEATDILKSISFIKYADSDVEFVSAGYKKYAREKLKENRITFLSKLILLIESKELPSNLNQLTQYYRDKGDNNEVIQHIDDQYLVKLFESTNSLNDLQKNVSIGLESSIYENNQPKIIKYSHIKSALSNINTSSLLMSELKCYLAEGDMNSAIELIESSKANEEKLQLYATYSVHAKEQKIDLEDDIKRKIDFLFDQVNLKNLGDEKIIDIASDLFPVFPKKAMKLINELDSSNSSGQNKSDFAFFKLSVETLKKHGNSFSDDLEEFDGFEDKKSQMFETIKIFNPESPINTVIKYIDNIEEVGDKIFMIRSWLKKYFKKDGAITLLDKALDLIMSSVDFSSDASLFGDIASCIIYSKNTSADAAYKRIASQLENIRKKGPTVNYCQLLLLIIKYEKKHIIQNDRVDDLITYVLTINDNSVSLACLSIISKFLTSESIPLINFDIEDSKETLVNKLLVSDAYHIDAFKDALWYEARNNIQTALAWSNRLNTEPRRDRAKAISIRSYCLMSGDKKEKGLSYVVEQVRYIKDEHHKVNLYKTVIKNIEKFKPSKKDLEKVFKLINRIENRNTRAECYTEAIKTGIKLKLYSSVPESIFNKIKEAISLVDGIWNQVSLAFLVHEKILKYDSVTALEFKKLAIDMRHESKISNQYVIEYLTNSISLAIRCIYVLTEYNLDSDDEFDLLLNAIGNIPSGIIKIKLLSKLVSAYQKKSTPNKPKVIIEDYILPILDTYPSQVSTEYNICASTTLPVLALYKISVFKKYIDKIGKKDKVLKDRSIIATLNYIYRDCLLGDPFDPLKNYKYKVSFSDLIDVIDLIDLIADDGSCLYQIQSFLEVVVSLRKNQKLTGTQQQDLLAKLKEKFGDEFPRDDYIKHEGYKVLLMSLFEKVENKGDLQSWKTIVNEARKIPNISDRAFTLIEISEHLEGKYTVLNLELLKEADKLIDSLSSNMEKVNRYSQLCEKAKGVDKKLAKEAITKALKITGKSDIDDNSNVRLEAIDMAHKLGDSFSSSLSNLFDDDPARKKSIIENIASKKREDEYKKKFEKNGDIDKEDPDNSVFRLAWKQLGSLNANSCHCSKGFEINKYFNNEESMSMEQYYMLLSFYIHYLNKIHPGKENARNKVSPIFNEIIANVVTVSSIYSSKEKLEKCNNDASLKPTDHIVINEGEHTKAVSFIKNWFEKNGDSELIIIDPYFTLDDLNVVGEVIDRDPEIKIKVLTSIESMKKMMLPNIVDFDDLISDYWNEYISKSSLPSFDFIFVGYGAKGQIPIHDRWWLTSNSGIHTGTSLNGFAQRVSQIKVLSLDDKVRVEENLTPYLEMEKTRFQDQKVKYKREKI